MLSRRNSPLSLWILFILHKTNTKQTIVTLGFLHQRQFSKKKNTLWKKTVLESLHSYVFLSLVCIWAFFYFFDVFNYNISGLFNKICLGKWNLWLHAYSNSLEKIFNMKWRKKKKSWILSTRRKGAYEIFWQISRSFTSVMKAILRWKRITKDSRSRREVMHEAANGSVTPNADTTTHNQLRLTSVKPSGIALLPLSSLQPSLHLLRDF